MFNIMHRYFILLIGIFWLWAGNIVVAQSDLQVPKKARKLFDQSQVRYNWQDYSNAMLLLNKAIKKYPTYVQAYRRLAEIQWERKDYPAAEATFKKLLAIKPNSLNEFAVNGSIGQMAYEQHDYDKAIVYLNKALSTSKAPPNSNDYKRAKRLLENAEFAAQSLKNPVPFKPIRLDSTINTYRDEYLPMLTADEGTLVFTRRMNSGFSANEDFYISRRQEDSLKTWGIATPMQSPINTETNEGAICISPDGKTLFFAAKDRKDTEGGFDLYYCYKKDGDWIGPFNLGRPINTPAWESQPSISADGHSLYFASRRKGGYGGIDIWVSHLGNNNYWGEPENLGPLINTPEDEQTPFIHPDNQTLYFSSNGHIGMGDADIYVVRRDTVWGKPQNLGYPINTFGNESGFVVAANGQRAYFAALNDSLGLDIFYFDLPPTLKPRYVNYVKGKVFDADKTKRMLAADIELIDLDSGAAVLKTISDPKTGEFLTTLTAGRNYMCNVSKAGYLFHSEHFALKDSLTNKPFVINVPLKPIHRDTGSVVLGLGAGQSVILKNVFFATDSYQLQATSFRELDRLVQLLNENTAMRVEIGGHTDNTGKAAYNLTLSENRANAVYDYLIQKGIDKKRLTYKGYGDTMPIADNNTPDGRSINRRTEFKVLGQ